MDCEHKPRTAIGLERVGFPEESGADFLEGFLRAKVVLADNEHDAIDEAEGVIEHQRFQLAIVAAAPE
ncbi:MAG TPA: hypothetical protein VIW21_06205, partial [Chthoniobacterales bacterium]